MALNSVDEARAEHLRETLTNMMHSGGDWHILHSSLEFTKELGTGKFSTVFKGFYKGQTVAIKVLNDQAQTEELEREFKKEFQVMSLMNHPHIIRFIGACLNPRICIVMVKEEKDENKSKIFSTFFRNIVVVEVYMMY